MRPPRRCRRSRRRPRPRRPPVDMRRRRRGWGNRRSRGGISVCCRVRAKAVARCSEASARSLTRSGSRSYSRRSVASKSGMHKQRIAARLTFEDGADEHRRPVALRANDGAGAALHLRHRGVVGLVIDLAGRRDQLCELPPADDVGRCWPRPSLPCRACCEWTKPRPPPPSASPSTRSPPSKRAPTTPSARSRLSVSAKAVVVDVKEGRLGLRRGPGPVGALGGRAVSGSPNHQPRRLTSTPRTDRRCYRREVLGPEAADWSACSSSPAT